MNPRTKELAEQAGATHKQRLGVYQFYADELEEFVALIKKDNTRGVVNLCAKTIDTNLREQERKSKNKKELVEFFVISVTLVTWGCWWYSMGH